LSRLERHGSKAISNLGRNFERLALVGATGGFFLGKAIVEAAADFDDAMARVEKTLSAENKTPENLQKIEDGLLGLSKVIPVTAVELAEIAKQAGQLGIESADDILAFTETLAKLSRVTELDVTYAAENMGKLRTLFKMNADELDHFGQVLVALENSGASTVQEILNVTRRFAGAAQAAGLAADETAAFASTITSLGILPEAAGSALSRLFQRTRVEFASTSKKAKAFAKFMGEPFDELKKRLAENPAQFFMDFFRKANSILKNGTPAEKMAFAKTLKDLGINNVRDIDAVNKLAEGYDELAKQMGIATSATDELDEAAKSRFKSFASQFQLFQNKLMVAAIYIGNAIMPALVEGMTLLSDWIEDHEADIKRFADDLGRSFMNFMKSIKPEDINAFVGVIRSAVGFAQTLVSTFMGLPGWLRELLVAMWVGNKLTGGVLGDIIGELGKGLIKGVLGITAGVVNVFAKTLGANPGGGGGGGGSGKGGKPTPGGGGKGGVPRPTIENPGSKGSSFNNAGKVLGVGAIIASLFKGDTVPVKDMTVQQRIEQMNRSIDSLRKRPGSDPAFEGSSETVTQAIERLRKGIMKLQEWEAQAPNREAQRKKDAQQALAALRKAEQTESRNAERNRLILSEARKRIQDVDRQTGRVRGAVDTVRGATNRVREAVDRVADKPHIFRSTVNASIKVVVDGKTVAVATYQNSTGSTVNRDASGPGGATGQNGDGGR
jgi:TP901 family phage tail tape measure protein